MGGSTPQPKLIDRRYLDAELQSLRSELVETLADCHDDPEDIRCVVVGNLILQCDVTASILRMVWPLLQQPARAVELGLVSCLPLPDQPGVVLRTILEQSKMNLVLNWMFQTEHFAEQVAIRLAFKSKVGSGGFDYANLLKRLRVGAPMTRARALRILALVRNSLHNNGVHAKQSKSFAFAGNRYRFKQGASVMCAGWEVLFPLLHSSVDTLSEVLKSAAVARQSYMPDTFASRVGRTQLAEFKNWMDRKR